MDSKRVKLVGGKYRPQTFESLHGAGDWNVGWHGDWFVCSDRLWNKTEAGKAVGGWAAHLGDDNQLLFMAVGLTECEMEVVQGLPATHFPTGNIYVNAEISPDAVCRRADLTRFDGGFSFEDYEEAGGA